MSTKPYYFDMCVCGSIAGEHTENLVCQEFRPACTHLIVGMDAAGARTCCLCGFVLRTGWPVGKNEPQVVPQVGHVGRYEIVETVKTGGKSKS